VDRLLDVPFYIDIRASRYNFRGHVISSSAGVVHDHVGINIGNQIHRRLGRNVIGRICRRVSHWDTVDLVLLLRDSDLKW
jgi:hypothetical protein